MSTLFSVCGHVILSACIGFSLLVLLHRTRDVSFGETLVTSILLGFYAETLLVFTIMLLGISLASACLIVVCGTLLVMPITIVLLRKDICFRPFSIKPLRWYEWLLVVCLLEKVVFAVWQLARTPVWGFDALVHWAGRGRSLYGGVNWSFDPDSSVFLGFSSTAKNYPLGTPIWRAVTAQLNGGWNDILARADSFLFFIVLVLSVWLIIHRFSGKRYLAAIGVFIISSLPLQVWHAAAGYNDIAVEAYIVAAVAAILCGDWLLAGVFVAGAGWMKNEGLVVFGTAFLGAMLVSNLLNIISGKLAINDKSNWKNVGVYLLGLFTLVPSLIFNTIQQLGFAAYGSIKEGSLGVSFRPHAVKIFVDSVIFSPTHSVFWLCVFPSVLLLSLRLLKDSIGRVLFFVFIFVILEIAMIYCATNAVEYLEDGTAIYRSMLQVSGLAVVTVIYGIWLAIKKAESDVK